MRFRLVPPSLFLISLGAMIALRLWLPGPRFFTAPWSVVGFFLFNALCVALVAWALWHFFRMRTTYHPHKKPTALVVSGPYRFSRNPMYLSILLSLTGFAFLFGHAAPFAVPPLCAAAITRVFIRREEKLLEAKFGEQYRDFIKRTRRWL